MRSLITRLERKLDSIRNVQIMILEFYNMGTRDMSIDFFYRFSLPTSATAYGHTSGAPMI